MFNLISTIVYLETFCIWTLTMPKSHIEETNLIICCTDIKSPRIINDLIGENWKTVVVLLKYLVHEVSYPINFKLLNNLIHILIMLLRIQINDTYLY